MDSLWLKVGGLPAPIGVPASGCSELRPSSGLSSQINVSRSSSSSTAAVSLDRRNRSNSPWGISFRFPAIGSLWPKGGGNGKSSYDNALAVDEAAVLAAAAEEEEEEQGGDPPKNRKGGIFSILNVRTGGEENAVLNDRNGEDGEDGEESGGDCEACSVDYCENDDDEKIGFDKDSFTKLLQRVSLAEARLYAQMSGLGNLAYSIPKIKPGNLLKDYGLEFVTSSLEKREQRLKADQEKEKENAEPGESGEERDHSVDKQAQDVQGNGDEGLSIKEERVRANRLSAATAYQIAASAASYLHSRTKSILPFQSQSTTGQDMIHMNEGMPSTDSVTAVVAAKEEVKQAVADDLNSVLSSPCEWFICDDDQNATRFFVIQGSESVASWQANLLFEPVQFEGFDVLVHRGIYEAAKGIYEQILPEVHSHLKSHGRRANFRFTGHSLGGSLSMLINLMLLIRGEVPLSSLLPVITFGAPTVMCGGDSLLKKLGLPRSHVKAIAMHRDIVPRAFSCNYPNHIAEILKAVNGKFRTLPCLTKQKLLYGPMGELLILQPDDAVSPSHDLLPAGSGLYLLTCSAADAIVAEKQMRAAKAVFLNSPHPLDILSDRAAYGSGGTIQRDHDMISYLKCVKNVIKEEEERNAKREQEHRDWWRNVASSGINIGIMHGAEESFKRFTRMVSSQRLHLIVVFLFPARLMILGALSAISFH